MAQNREGLGPGFRTGPSIGAGAGGAKEVTTTIKELNATIASLDKAVPQIQKAGETLENTGNPLLHRLFLGGATLIALFWAGAFIFAAVYRRRSSTKTPRQASD